MGNPDLVKHLEEAAATATAAAAELRSPRSKHWVDQYHDGEILLSDDAAHIAGVSRATIIRRCEASLKTAEPLGIIIAHTIVLVDLARLLDWIEREEGLHSRRVAETSSEKNNADLRLRTQKPIELAATASSEPSIVPPKSAIS